MYLVELLRFISKGVDMIRKGRVFVWLVYVCDVKVEYRS